MKAASLGRGRSKMRWKHSLCLFNYWSCRALLEIVFPNTSFLSEDNTKKTLQQVLMQLQAEMVVSLEDFMRRPGCSALMPPSKKVYLMQNLSWLGYRQLKMNIVLARLLESGIESALWEYSWIKLKYRGVDLRVASAHLVLLMRLPWPYFFVDVWPVWQQGASCWYNLSGFGSYMLGKE